VIKIYLIDYYPDFLSYTIVLVAPVSVPRRSTTNYIIKNDDDVDHRSS
ncbi:MAG: hypothetical protein ACI90V_013962, partial [Bacillariaceae sp.]